MILWKRQSSRGNKKKKKQKLAGVRGGKAYIGLLGQNILCDTIIGTMHHCAFVQIHRKEP
jgi:hypothetical protein